MREFIKVMCVVVLMVAAVVAALAWSENRPTPTTWWLRIALPLACLAALAVFLVIHFQVDEVSDYLQQAMGRYLDRDGFCLAMNAMAINGVCCLRLYFQNRFERPCSASVALRPVDDFVGRSKLDSLVVEIPCEAAAFGVATVPISVPPAYQGKVKSFTIGVSVAYPDGKGRQLRFRSAPVIRMNADFRDSTATLLQVGSFLSWHILLHSLLHKPLRIAVRLPPNVRADIAPMLPAQVQTLWKLGDPEIKP
jgi:hypothetical protein